MSIYRHEILKRVPAVMALALACAPPALAREEMTDAQLDAVTAGTAAVADEELFRIGFDKVTGSGRSVSGDATFQLIDASRMLNQGMLSLSGNAQSNLNALVNINAVNSPVNVLLNLNVNIDSEVGSLNQFNINTPIPSMPVR